jgi:hypothetical protein
VKPYLAVIALALAASALVAPAFADPLDPTDVRVLDGDTIEAHGAVFRLVGYIPSGTPRRH